MPRKSQRKGRGAEFEIRNILKAAGWDSAVRGMYEEKDVLWGLRGRDRLCEVKRRKSGMDWAYRALLKEGNHAVFFRADHKPWVVIQLFSEYIQDNGPRWPETEKNYAAELAAREEDENVDCEEGSVVAK